jgi:ABC-2 type transport system permease protein
MRVILTIAAKDLRLLLRDRTNAFFVIVFPLAIAIFFGSIFGGSSRSIPVAVVIESAGPAATDFANALEKDSTLSVRILPSREEADASVRLGRVAACVIIPKTFDADLEKAMAGSRAIVEVHCDPARQAESGLVVGKLNEHAMRAIVRMFTNPKINSKMLAQSKLALVLNPNMTSQQRERVSDVLESVQELFKQQNREAAAAAAAETSKKIAGSVNGDSASNNTENGNVPVSTPSSATSPDPFLALPIKIQSSTLASESTEPPSTFAVTFPQGLAWGFVGCIGAFGAGMAEERRRGTFMRLLLAPCTIFSVLAGKSLACFTACVTMSLFMLLVATLGFHVSVQNWFMLALAIATCSFAFSGFTMALSGLFKNNEGSARSAGNAIVLVLVMIGGGTIPLAFMPPFLRAASQASPFSWAILAIEGAVWRGFAFTEMLAPLGILLFIGALGLMLGNVFIKKRARG